MSSPRDIDDYQRVYAATDFEPVQARMRKRKLQAVLAAWQPKRVLEVGCADDALFKHYRDFDRYCVVEPGASFAALARDEACGDARIRVVQAFMEDAVAALAAEHFDCVLLSGLLHEVREVQPVLAAVAAVCKPDTRVHVNVPNARSLHRLLALEMGLIDTLHVLSDQQRTLQQHHTFDMTSLSAACTQAGFDVFEQGSYFVKPFTHRQMARLQTEGLLDERMLAGLYGLERHLPGLGSEIYVHLRPSSAAPEA